MPHTHLDPTQLFTVLLPPLLFESAINLRVEALRREWKPIAIYALGGTVLSTFIVGGLIAWTLRIPLAVAMVFGALISATDPIAVMGIFNNSARADDLRSSWKPRAFSMTASRSCSLPSR